MVELERTYIVPLRKEIMKVPKYKRAKKAVKALREFLSKHMKSDNIKIGRHLNLFIWQNGIKNPPTKIRIHAKKYDDGLVRTELEGKTFEEPKKEKKKTGLAGKLEELTGKKGKLEKEKKEKLKTEVKVEKKIEEKKEKVKEGPIEKIEEKPIETKPVEKPEGEQ